MPAEQGYDPRIDPREGTAQPLASAAALGGQVGEALAGAGGVVHEQQLRAYQIERKLIADRELSAAERAFAEHRLKMGDTVRDLRQNSAPGGEGHVKAVGEAEAAGRSAILDGITDPRVRAHMTSQMDDWGVELTNGEANWQQAKGIARQIDDSTEADNLSGNIVRRGEGDQDLYKAEMKRRFDAIEMLNVDDDTKAKLHRQAEREVGVGFLLGVQDKDPALALAVLKSGAFDHLPADTLESLRNSSEVELRRKQAEADHQTAMARAQFGDVIGAIKTDFGNGVEIADATFAQAIDIATKMGDQSMVADLKGMQADNRWAKVWGGQNPLARQSRVQALQGKPKRSADEDRELKWLGDHREALDSRFKSDPVGFASTNGPRGTGPPAGDIFGDPSAMQARLDWRRSASTVSGMDMPVFTKAEVDALAQRKDSGVQGEDEVIGVLDRIPDPRVRMMAARQIDPQDKVFQHLVVLAPRARATVRAGAHQLQANPQYLNFKVNSREAVAVGGWETIVRTAMKSMDPGDVDATLTLTRQFSAGVFSGRGIAPSDNAAVWQNGTRVALGGSVHADGRVTGGIGFYADGQPFLLPENTTQNEFSVKVVADVKSRSAKEAPRNPDGSVFMLRTAHPVYIGNDPNDPQVSLYRWETRDGRTVQGTNAKGEWSGPYVSRIRDN